MDLRSDIFLLSMFDYAVFPQLGHQLKNPLLFGRVVTQTGLSLHVFENGPGFINGLFGPFRFVSIDNSPNPFSVLRKLSSLLFLFNDQEDDGQLFPMNMAEHSGEFMVDLVGHPVLRRPRANNPLQGQSYALCLATATDVDSGSRVVVTISIGIACRTTESPDIAK